MNTRQTERLPRPYAELDNAFIRHCKAQRRLKTLVLVVCIVTCLLFLASWLWPEVTAIWESRAKDRYEEVHRIVLDGRVPALKKVMRDAVKGKRKLRGEFPFDHNPAKADTLYQARED